METAAARASVRDVWAADAVKEEAAWVAVKVSGKGVGGRAVEMEAAVDREAEERAAAKALAKAAVARVAERATRNNRRTPLGNDRARRASCLAGRCPHNSRVSTNRCPCELLRNRSSTPHRTD